MANTGKHIVVRCKKTIPWEYGTLFRSRACYLANQRKNWYMVYGDEWKLECGENYFNKHFVIVTKRVHEISHELLKKENKYEKHIE